MGFLLRAPLSLHHITILLCVSYMVVARLDSQTTGNSNVSCIDSERWALLKFKSSLVFDSERQLSGWSHENMDCCRWEGLRCNKAGHVVTIDLHRPYSKCDQRMSFFIPCDDSLGRIRGEISPSLLHLSYLNYLDLSNNNFTKIPEFVGSLKRLRYLNFSQNPLTQKFPHQLGNLSVLETLDLNSPESDVHVDSLAWIARLTSLKYLDMSYVMLHSAKDWLQSILELPSLTNLYLRGCNLPFPAPTEINSSTSLEVVVISGYSFRALSPLLNASTKLVDLTIKLYLSQPIPEYLTKLVSIKFLDLSFNDFEGALPETFSNLTNLRKLDLSHNFLKGVLPGSFSKLINLISLNLSSNFLEGALPGSFSNLSNLISLDVSMNNMKESYGFLQSGSNSLQELLVNNNELQETVPNLSKFPSLQMLNLANNEFRGGLAQLLRQSSNLSMLDVSSNHFYETLTRIPFSNFSTLQVLNLAKNELAGNLAQLLQHSSNLIKLDVSSNHFHGTLAEALFQNLTKLRFLSLSLNSLSLNFSTGFTPPFQLQVLKLRACELGKIFPQWLRTQKKLVSLDISDSGISDTIPSWFWNISSKLKYLNVSHNSISGSLRPNSLPSCDLVDLSSNRFYGTLPSFSTTLSLLDVSSNAFYGGISFLCGLDSRSLSYLDLSNNFLSGILPNCLKHIRRLFYLNLDNNNFTGSFLNSVGGYCHLQSLRLRNNSFFGNLPRSLGNCTSLFLLDLGGNQFSGTIPDWIGTSVTGFAVLRLNSNKFEGNIPSNLCHLHSIEILDLSFNNISGTIPACLNNFTAMADGYRTFESHLYPGAGKGADDEIDITNLDGFTAWLFWKGLQVEFKNVKTVELLKYIDLSSNKLSGMIPEEITSLYKLVVLNLSHNVLIGQIPNNIGVMSVLESLDLSHNLLSGEIPSSMANLFTLSYMDLSYNNLTGSIPLSTQISTFNATMFRGNLGLCGAPLPYSCHRGETVNYDLPNTQGGDGNQNLGMYISIALGFIVGFWGVCGPLLIKNSWRRRYFQSLTHIKERLLVAILIGLANFRRKFAR